MRIAFDGRCLSGHYPGIGRYAFNLLRSLRQRAPQAELTVFVGNEDQRFPWNRLDGVRLEPVDVPVRRFREQLVLPRRLRRMRADTARLLGVDVLFLGEVSEEDLPVLYSGAETVVVPSFCEGFGLPVVEAMACGTPVACSDVSSLPEVAGGAAALFDPRSTASMVEVLTRLRRDAEYRKNLAARGLERAAELTWDQAAERTLEVYRRILSSP